MNLGARFIGSALLVGAAAAQQPPSRDPAAFFHPTVTLNNAERTRLDRGDALVKVVGSRGREVAIFSAVKTTATGERLAEWVSRIEAFKQGSYVPAVARFSQPPRAADLAALALDDDDLNAIRNCRPGDCGLKLSAAEIARLRDTAAAAGSRWKPEVEAAFRQVLLARVDAYLAGGLGALAPHHDHGTPLHLQAEFAELSAHSPFLALRLPALNAYFERFPQGGSPSMDSFIYWSKEVLGGKPIVGATHVVIARSTPRDDLPAVVVAARQLYASHYMTGSLAITTITTGDRDTRYLMYLNRSRVDVLGGFFGGLVRRVMERRLRTEAGEVVQTLRRRLESGPPPPP